MAVFHGLKMGLRAFAAFVILFVSVGSRMTADTITFEGLVDGTILTTQYPGVTFSNAIILTAGVTLNEFEFPPHSGTNVVSDNGGPMSISFNAPVTSLEGYFTYSEALGIVAFDSRNSKIASAVSAFSNNERLSGDPGSTPNEFLFVSSAAGISRLTITGDQAGGSFVLDDLTFGSSQTSTPEPTALLPLGLALMGIANLRRRK